MNVDFKTITIIGLGMIGGSFAKALRTKGFSGRIYGFDRDESTVIMAYKDGVINNSNGYDKSIIKQADLLILATPIGKFNQILSELSEYLNPTCLVTDVASVKKSVHDIASDILGQSLTFIGGHPMIGSEKTGYTASKAHLFENSYYFLTKDYASGVNVERLKGLIEFIGGKVCMISPEDHDMMVAKTSHIPHLNASLLVNLLDNNESNLIDYVGSGFRDTTRIASGDPDMWCDIFIHNKEEVIKAIDDFMEDLKAFRKRLEEEENSSIISSLNKAKETRSLIPRHLIDSIEPEHSIFIDVVDRPGMIARVTGLMADNNINIKDIEILHARETVPGVLKIGFYDSRDSIKAKLVLDKSDFGEKHTIKTGFEIN